MSEDTATPAKKPMKLLICTLFYERKGWSPYISSLVKTVCLLNTLGVDFDYWELSEDSYVDRARNTVGNYVLNHPEITDLIFIDSDEEWNLEGFGNLLRSDADFVGAGYPCKNVWDFYSCILNTDENGIPIVRADGLISATGVPTGFSKVRRTVFEQLAEKMPDNVYEAVEPDHPDKKIKFFNFYGRIQPMGEDISFCYRWRSIGGECWVQPNVTITHYGTKGWKGNYHEAMRRWPGGSHEGQPMPWDVKPEVKAEVKEEETTPAK